MSTEEAVLPWVSEELRHRVARLLASPAASSDTLLTVADMLTEFITHVGVCSVDPYADLTLVEAPEAGPIRCDMGRMRLRIVQLREIRMLADDLRARAPNFAHPVNRRTEERIHA